MPLEQFAHEALGCRCIAAALYQHIQNKTVLIDRALQPVFLAADRDHNLVEMPLGYCQIKLT